MHECQLGKWNATYAGRPQQPYDDPQSYRRGAEFLKDCRQVEDWGCGYGWFGRTLQEHSSTCVRNLDGSRSDFVHEVVDLQNYRSHVEGIFLRGVLEHNYAWPQILSNALHSFTHKMALVCFTPFSHATRNLYDFRFNDGGTVPVLSLSHSELTACLQSVPGIICHVESLASQTEFGIEHIFYLEKPQPRSGDGRLTILCATTGRSTLPAMLESVCRQPLEKEDEVLLINDGPPTADLRALWHQAGLPGMLLTLPEGPHGDCGETPRNKTTSLARGDYVVNLDDDDQLAPGALTSIRRAIQTHPGSFFFFQVELPDGSRYWDRPEVRWGNVGTSMFVAPTGITWGRRGNFQGGDYYFILQTLSLNSTRAVRWIDEPVFLIRPHTKGVA